MNNQKLNLYFCFVLCAVLCSCARGEYRKNQKNLATLSANKQYKAVEEFVKKKSFLGQKDNVLLKNLELGKAYYNNDKYCNAIERFDEAGRIVEEQQTKSIGSAISSAVGNGEGVFYGETYEKSILNFYKSLLNYKIYQRGYCEPIEDVNNKQKKENKYFNDNEKNNFLTASRSNILYWDSWMNSRYIEEDDKFYIDDILLKLWGAFIHEQIGDNANLQIARQLYKDAKNIAQNRYIVYKPFNFYNDGFVNHLKDIEKRSSFVEKDNIYVKDVIEYCDRQLERLSKREKVNFAIVLSDGDIATKTVTEHRIPILSVLSTASASLRDIIISFAIDRAKYELPYISYKPTNYRYFYELRSEDGSVVVRKPLVLSEPITDISYMSLNEKFDGIKKRVIASMTAKYLTVLTPIAATYAVARKSKNQIVQLVGYLTALLSYKGSEYLITEGSRVDIRQWVDLPANIFMVSDRIEKGKYHLSIVKQSNFVNLPAENGVVNNTQEMVVYSKDIEIGDNVSFFDVKA